MFPWNETLSAELDCSLLNAQSWNKIKQINHIVVRRATVLMIDINNSSQEYFLMFKNSVIASIFVVPIHMARNHFITHDGFPFFVQKESNYREM